MALHWVKAVNTVTRTDEHGHLIRLLPGTMFQVKNMELAHLVSTGQVQPFDTRALANVFDMSDCGCAVAGNSDAARLVIRSQFPDMQVAEWDGASLPYARTLLWDGKAHLRLDLIPIGFHRLAKGWQIAAPLYSYGRLARDLGDDADRQRTREVIHDLRVPVYETGLMYIYRCEDTERLIEAWRDERTDGGDTRLAFMRALYRAKPVMCALPTTWIQ